jgi:hypothetical protein
MAKRTPHQAYLEHMALVGSITQNWNYLEHQMGVIAWFLTKDPEAAYAFTARMRNAELCGAILDLAEMREKRPRYKAAIKFLVAAFNVLRENRNALVHSDPFRPRKGTKGEWQRKSKSKPRELIVVQGDMRDLEKLDSDLGKTQNFANELMLCLSPDDWFVHGPSPFAGKPLPRRFPLPRKMLQPLQPK